MFSLLPCIPRETNPLAIARKSCCQVHALYWHTFQSERVLTQLLKSQSCPTRLGSCAPRIGIKIDRLSHWFSHSSRAGCQCFMLGRNSGSTLLINAFPTLLKLGRHSRHYVALGPRRMEGVACSWIFHPTLTTVAAVAAAYTSFPFVLGTKKRFRRHAKAEEIYRPIGWCIPIS